MVERPSKKKVTVKSIIRSNPLFKALLESDKESDDDGENSYESGPDLNNHPMSIEIEERKGGLPPPSLDKKISLLSKGSSSGLTNKLEGKANEQNLFLDDQ